MNTVTARRAALPLETPRLTLREMTPGDLCALENILCDEQVMRAAYECAFTREEARGWLERHLRRYENDGFGLWAVVRKDTGEMIGQCGITLQSWREEPLVEIGFLFARRFWHQGYATEAAAACKAYAFSVLGAERVYSIIRDSNTAARSVAQRIGMTPVDRDRKPFRNVEMDFCLYAAGR